MPSDDEGFYTLVDGTPVWYSQGAPNLFLDARFAQRWGNVTEPTEWKTSTEADGAGDVWSLAVPVKVGGTLAKPSVVPDPGKIAENVVGTVVGAPEGIFNTLSSLTGQKAATAEQNPCAAAISGKAQPAKASTATQSGGTTAGSGATTGTTAPSSSGKGVVEDTVEGIGKTLDNLFGN